MTGNPSFTRSHQTEQLVRTLLSFNKDDISYVDIMGRVGYHVDGASTALRSARRILERDYKIVYETVIGRGIRRLKDGEKVHSTARFVRGIRRTANRGNRRLASIDAYETMNNADQLLHTIRSTQFAHAKSAVSNKRAPDAVAPVNNDDIKRQLKNMKAS